MSISNIKKVLAQADAIDFTEGKAAYRNYHELLKVIADFYNVGFVQTVQAFVSLSPNNDYVGNLRSLVTLINGVKTNISVDKIKCSTYKHCRDRAYEYFVGNKDFLIETKGLKITAFYHNILKPDDKSHITIDGHMHNVWSGTRRTMKEVAILKMKYETIEKDFKFVARQACLIPNQLQAICWFTWKRINNIIFNPQLDLLNPSDHWRLIRNPENIKLL